MKTDESNPQDWFLLAAERLSAADVFYGGCSDCHGPKRCRYSLEVMNALTISALTKLPLN